MDASTVNYLQELQGILTENDRILFKLVSLEKDKYDILKQVDAKQLMEINTAQEDMLQTMEYMEMKRKEILASLALEFGFKSGMSLREIIPFLPVETQPEFTRLRESIKNQSEELKSLMHINSELIRSNLDIINFTLNFARQTQTETYNYRDKHESKENIFMVNHLA